MFIWNYKSNEEASSVQVSATTNEICTLLNLTPKQCQLLSAQEFIIDLSGDTLSFSKEITEEIQAEEESLNVDSIVDAALENIGMEGNIDTAIKIDLAEENTEQ